MFGKRDSMIMYTCTAGITHFSECVVNALVLWLARDGQKNVYTCMYNDVSSCV